MLQEKPHCSRIFNRLKWVRKPCAAPCCFIFHQGKQFFPFLLMLTSQMASHVLAAQPILHVAFKTALQTPHMEGCYSLWRVPDKKWALMSHTFIAVPTQQHHLRCLKYPNLGPPPGDRSDSLWVGSRHWCVIKTPQGVLMLSDSWQPLHRAILWFHK